MLRGTRKKLAALVAIAMAWQGSSTMAQQPVEIEASGLNPIFLGKVITVDYTVAGPIHPYALDDDEGAEGTEESEPEMTMEERVAALEANAKANAESIEGITEDLGGLEEDVDDLSGDKTVVKSGTSKSTMKVSGRVHVDGWGFDTDPNVAFFNDPDRDGVNESRDPENRLGFRRLRFGVAGKIKDNMRYKIEMEFAGGNNSEFRDAYLGWENLAFFQTLLLGNQKRPYGLDHLNSSRYNVFIERPFVIEAFNEDARRLGLCSYGVSEDQAWNWRYGVYNTRNVQALGNYVDDHLQLQVAGRLANTIWYDQTSGGRGYAHWAIAGTHAAVSDVNNNTTEARFRTRAEARSSNRWLNTDRIAGADNYQIVAAEGVVNIGALQIVGEYQSLFLDRHTSPDLHFNGCYAYVSYFLTGEHIPWSRSSGTLGRVVPFQNFWLVDRCGGGRSAGWGAWQIAARFSVADFSDEDILGGEGDALTIGLNWHWNPNARIQFNYIDGRIENQRVGVGTAAVPAFDVRDGDYNVYGIRAMVDF